MVSSKGLKLLARGQLIQLIRERSLNSPAEDRREEGPDFRFRKRSGSFSRSGGAVAKTSYHRLWKSPTSAGKRNGHSRKLSSTQTGSRSKECWASAAAKHSCSWVVSARFICTKTSGQAATSISAQTGHAFAIPGAGMLRSVAKKQ